MKRFLNLAVICLMLLPLIAISGCKTIEVLAIGSDSSAKAARNATHVKKITYTSSDKGTLVKIYGSKPFNRTSYKLSAPPRIAIEISNSVLDFATNKIKINSRNLAYISAIPFPDVNSVRVELEIFTDTPYRVTQRSGYLEVLMSDNIASAGLFSDIQGEEVDMNTISKMSKEDLIAENRKLALKLKRAESNIKELEEEAFIMEKEMMTTNSKVKTLEQKTAFMEGQLRSANTKLSTPIGFISALPAAGAAAGTTISASLPSPLSSATGMASLPVKGGAVATPPEPATITDEEEKSISATITEWAAAWEAEDINSYASFYAASFQSGNKDKTRWVAGKSAKFERKSHPKIGVENLSVTATGGGAKAKFIQVYESASFASTGKKTLSLQKQDGQWKITSEVWKKR